MKKRLVVWTLAAMLVMATAVAAQDSAQSGFIISLKNGSSVRGRQLTRDEATGKLRLAMTDNSYAVIAAGFGIAAVLIVSVVQKSKEIGILRAMGTSRGQILRVFLAEAALLRSESTLRGILDAAKESIWLFSPDGKRRLNITNDPRYFDIHPKFSPVPVANHDATFCEAEILHRGCPTLRVLCEGWEFSPRQIDP